MSNQGKVKPDLRPVHDRLMDVIFSSKRPGDKLIERELASTLGVSRVPIREALVKMAARGSVVGGGSGQGLRVREYSPDEVRDLYEFREMLEVGSVRCAASRADDQGFMALEMICDQMEDEIGEYGSARWAQLDHSFHITLARAGRNDRFVDALGSVLTESHYIFFLHPSRRDRGVLTAEEIYELMNGVTKDHRELLDLIRAGDADAAERRVRDCMQKSMVRATRSVIESSLTS